MSISSFDQMRAVVQKHCRDVEHGKLSKQDLCTLMLDMSCNIGLPASHLHEFCQVIGNSGVPEYIGPICELLWDFRAFAFIAHRANEQIKRMDRFPFDTTIRAIIQTLLSCSARIPGKIDSTTRSSQDFQITTPHPLKAALEKMNIRVADREVAALFDVLARPCGGKIVVDLSTLTDQLVSLMKPARSRHITQQSRPLVARPQSVKARRRPRVQTPDTMLHVVRRLHATTPQSIVAWSATSRSTNRRTSLLQAHDSSLSPTYDRLWAELTP